jgi:hypothetical protein
MEFGLFTEFRSTLSVWMNVGGRIPHEQTLSSMRLFAERVAPRLA